MESVAYFDWDYSKEELEADRNWMWGQEHFSDGISVIGIETFLTFLILKNLVYRADYEKEFIDISLEQERDSVQTRIMNCGKPVVRYAFKPYEFEEAVRTHSKWITKIGDDKYRLYLKKFFYGWDNLTEKEKSLLGDDPVRAKQWCLICNMQLDFLRIDNIILGTFHLGFLYL